MTSYKDVWYNSPDGLRLYARDYDVRLAQNDDRPTVLCMHGLTRNSTDFETLCEALQDRYRLLVVDQRGRGLSSYDPNAINYTPDVYVQDMFMLLETLGVSKVILLATSLGGIMAIMMASIKPQLIQGIVINDIGPSVARRGLDRLKKSVGKMPTVSSWGEAAQQRAEINAIAFPEASDEDWLRFASRLYREDGDGFPVLAYDPEIALALNAPTDNTAAPDLWPVYKTIVDTPMLLIRGELSDLLESECVDQMRHLNPHLEYVEVPRVGHAPLLSETVALSAIQKFLQRFTHHH